MTTTALQTLLAAVERDDAALAREMLDNEPTLAAREVGVAHMYEGDINHWLYERDTPLHLAAAGYRVEIVRRLIAAGADVDACANRRAGRPLHYAADGYINAPGWNETRQLATIESLLDAGADLHAQDKNGATPLHRAVRTRCASAAALLLTRGARADEPNKSGSTAFHLAVQNTGRGGTGDDVAREAQRRIIERFLTEGVPLDLKDGKGRTVLESAGSVAVREQLAQSAC